MNAVGFGPVYTPFQSRRIGAAGQAVAAHNARVEAGTMPKRPKRSRKIDAAIVFLATDDAGGIGGALSVVDGGPTAL